MEDFLYDHSIETREKALDQLKEDTDKSYDEQIKTIQDYLSNEVQLYRDACSMIDNDNGTLYGKLLNYCLTYTTTGKKEFDHMWSLAQTAMEKYNVASIGTMQFMDELKGRIYDVDDAIDTVSKNIETYENRISDVKTQLDNLKDAAVEVKNAIDAANSTPLKPSTERWYVDYNGEKYSSFFDNKSDAINDLRKQVTQSVPFNELNPLLINDSTVKHYASGTRSAKSGIAQINENGLETLMKKTPNGDFVIMNQDDKVYTKKQTDNLYDFSGNPEQFFAKLADKGLSPLSQEELANLGLWGDMSQVMTDNEILSTIKANDFLKQYNAKGNVPDNQILNNINIYNTINGDVTPQMLRLLEQKEKDIIDKSIGKSVRATQDMLLRGRNLR